MEIRGIHAAEQAAMIDLQCRVFRPDGQVRFWRYLREDPTYRLDQNRVLLVDGQLVATLRVWQRTMRIGSCVLPMGGIGGVCTEPAYRGRGYASALMQEVIPYLQSCGYDLGVLFAIIPVEFYRRLGWASVPVSGFRLTCPQQRSRGTSPWAVLPFVEGRDLTQVMALYAMANAGQSGSIVRDAIYWACAPARLRGVLPTVVARQGDHLAGYLNYEVRAGTIRVYEVAYDPNEPGALVRLADYLLQQCAAQQVVEIVGAFSHRHPLIALLLAGGAGDLYLTGDAAMMCYALNLPRLLRRCLPNLQTRLTAARQPLAPVAICFTVNDQQAVIQLSAAGQLQVVEDDPSAIPLTVPAELFWRALLGESSWRQIQPALAAHGTTVQSDIADLLAILFPQQEVICWAPDHF